MTAERAQDRKLKHQVETLTGNKKTKTKHEILDFLFGNDMTEKNRETRGEKTASRVCVSEKMDFGSRPTAHYFYLS